MNLRVGAKVKFVHSPQEGVVMEIINKEMVSVFVEDWDMEIPVAVDDLLLADPTLLPGFQPQQVKVPKQKIQTAPPAHSAPTPPPKTKPTLYTGIRLAFEPVLDNSGLPQKFNLFLLNDTDHAVLYDARFYILNEQRAKRNGKLDAGQYVELGEMAYDELNDQPEAEVECWKIRPDGTGGRNYKRLRIKPKTFFSNLVEAPLLRLPAHLFTLFEKLSDTRQKNTEEDLKTYTQRNALPLAVLMDAVEERTPHEVREAAEFSLELDLHIEKLVQDHSRLSNAQIIQLQLRVFEDYIDQAIRLGMERVFIIHGLGKGRLRDAIASRLIRIPEVITFKNEYHPKYGHGATEVILIM